MASSFRALLVASIALHAVASLLENVIVQQRSVCNQEEYFEVTISTYHIEPVTVLESFLLRSRAGRSGDRDQLNKDIVALCDSYNVANCDSISVEIHRQYTEYLAAGTHTSSDRSDCHTVSVIDLGFDRHKANPKLLSVQVEPSIETSKHASDVLTVVSGYWHVQNKYQVPAGYTNPYEEWMHTTLRLHMPYIVFTDDSHAGLIKECRKGLPTLVVLRNHSDLKTHNTYNTTWTHPVHVPTADLATIWLEKINLLLLASQVSNTTYYAWVDAGLGTFRDHPLPQEEWSLDVILSLPPTRLSYALAHGSYHSFAAGVMILHRDLIPIIHKLFYEEYEICISTVLDWRCGSEQYILTQVRSKNPHLFHSFAYDYGDLSALWANKYPFRKGRKEPTN